MACGPQLVPRQARQIRVVVSGRRRGRRRVWPLPAFAKEDWDRLVTWDGADLPLCGSCRLLTALRARNLVGQTIGEAAMP